MIRLAKWMTPIIILVLAFLFFSIFLAWQGTEMVVGFVIFAAAFLFVWMGTLKGVAAWAVPMVLIIFGVVIMSGVVEMGTYWDSGTTPVRIGMDYDTAQDYWTTTATLDGQTDAIRFLLPEEHVDGCHSPAKEIRIAIKASPVSWKAATTDMTIGQYRDDLLMWYGGGIAGIGASSGVIETYRIQTGMGRLTQTIAVEVWVDGDITDTETLTLSPEDARRVTVDTWVGPVHVYFHGFIGTGVDLPSGDITAYQGLGGLSVARQVDTLEAVEDWNTWNAAFATLFFQPYLGSCVGTYCWEWNWPPTSYSAWQFLETYRLAPEPYGGIPIDTVTWLYGDSQQPNPIQDFLRQVTNGGFGEPPSAMLREFDLQEWGATITLYIPVDYTGEDLCGPWIEQPNPIPVILGSPSIGCTEEGTYGTLSVRVHNSGETGLISVSAKSTSGVFQPAVSSTVIQSGEAHTFNLKALAGAVASDTTGRITVIANGEWGETDTATVDWCIKDTVIIPGEKQATLIVRAINPNGNIIPDAQIYIRHSPVGFGSVTKLVTADVEHTVYGINTSAYYAPSQWVKVTLTEGEIRTVDLQYSDTPQGDPWWQALLDFIMLWWWAILIILIIIVVVALRVI